MAKAPNNGRNGRSEMWGVLASWATVILGLVFGIGGSIATAFGLWMAYINTRTSGLETRELGNAFSLGQLTERINNHGTALVGLDVTLQREMRQLDEAMIVRLDELDRRLQDEIARASEVGRDDRTTLRTAIDEMRKYQDRAREWNAAQDEQVRALERELFKENGP